MDVRAELVCKQPAKRQRANSISREEFNEFGIDNDTVGLHFDHRVMSFLSAPANYPKSVD